MRIEQLVMGQGAVEAGYYSIDNIRFMARQCQE